MDEFHCQLKLQSKLIIPEEAEGREDGRCILAGKLVSCWCILKGGKLPLIDGDRVADGVNGSTKSNTLGTGSNPESNSSPQEMNKQ